MAPAQTAVIGYTSSKSCFLFVPLNWIKLDSSHQDVPVFKLEYGNNRKAYFSGKRSPVPCSGSAHDVVQLNGKYALTLGLKEGQEVMVQQVDNFHNSVERVYLQPLQSDDWEMMQLNSSLLENNLLNQVRIVWKEQVFPVWVNQASLFVKVVDLVPSLETGLLVELTEIHVQPNERSHADFPHKKKKRKDNAFKQYQHLRKRKNVVASHHKPEMSPNLSYHNSDSNTEQQLIRRPVLSIFEYFMKSTFLNEPFNTSSPKERDYSFRSMDFDFSLRVISLSRTSSDSVSLPLSIQSTTAFISERTFRAHCHYDSAPDCFVANLSKLLSPLQKKELAHAESRFKEKSKKEKKDHTEETDHKYSSIFVNIVVLKSEEEEFKVPRALFMSTDYICIPRELKRRLGLEISSRVRCRGVDVQPFQFDTILLHPMDTLHLNFDDAHATSMLQEWFGEAVSEGSSIVLSDGTLVKLPTNKGRSCDFVITLMHSNEYSEQNSSFLYTSSSTTSSSSDKSFLSAATLPNYGFCNAISVKKLVTKLGSYSPYMKKSIWGAGAITQKIDSLYQSLPSTNLFDLGGIEHLSTAAVTNLEIWFKLRPLSSMSAASCVFPTSGSLLVTGEKGIGKSTFVKGLCREFINYPHFIFIMNIQCLPLRGKRIETIAKKWEQSLLECVHRQPSVLVFDDLHQLASAPATPDLENGPDALYFSSIAQVFLGLLVRIAVNAYKISVIATSKTVHSLHSLLTNMDGRCIFHTVLEIKPPDATQRCEILQSLWKSKPHLSQECMTSISWLSIAAKTEGYIAQDLCILIDRATHAAWVRRKNSFETDCYDKVSLVDDDFLVALTGYIPAALRDLHLQKGNNKTWADVGGLSEVKKILQQTLTWPTKYKSLFSSCTLKPQCNVLLYGPPGTGKTLLAGVVATECELNFICIKGPELLSKFIGASEQAVRDVFMRAMSARPCIIFFDEFDALAPRRGHDSTGVTDRVVNQLLTQMDGVESLEGVYVLAATSQPELIDPALLRPGRLDKCLFCPLPNEMERVEILNALTSKLQLSSDVDFKSIATITQHYSGADLQALLYSAQIMAFHDKKAGTSLNTTDISSNDFTEDMVYLSSLEFGAISPSAEESRAVMQEIDMLTGKVGNLNVSGRQHKRSSCISVVVGQTQLLRVLSTMKPSVSPEERRRYQLIFQKFQQTGGTDFATSLKGSDKRVTLA